MDAEVCLPSGKRVSTLRVKDLQKELHRRRLSIAGKKADLLARLTEYIVEFESASNSSIDPVTVSPVTREEQLPCEVFTKLERVTKEKLIKKKETSTKRRSHSRLNETFEYIESDDEG
ncbi:unnamed protein product [Cylicostephanus goldi]|uniref:SAP domain-containing protein n=1 Tax=Cylicostephanus goldi TaxID=71465 RepID=A0A3P6URK0_CYLGO|nr:unnamed protein product [Cylicostephanus goldi]